MITVLPRNSAWPDNVASS